jgi:hypothetical protein
MNAFERGLSRRHGRPPQIQNRGNFQAYYTPEGPVYAVNMDPYPFVTPDGVRVAPFRGRQRDVRATLGSLDAAGETPVTFSFNNGYDNPKFVRGIHKIAFELLAFYEGSESVMIPEYDPVREFVRFGIGKRHVLMSLNPGAQIEIVPLRNPRGGRAMAFCVVGLSFTVDLTHGQESMPLLVREATERYREWWCCPPWAA